MCFFHHKIQCIKSSASLPIEAIGRYRGDYPMVTHPENHGKIHGKRHIFHDNILMFHSEIQIFHGHISLIYGISPLIYGMK